MNLESALCACLESEVVGIAMMMLQGPLITISLPAPSSSPLRFKVNLTIMCTDFMPSAETLNVRNRSVGMLTDDTLSRR